jgi:hypothetical protein
MHAFGTAKAGLGHEDSRAMQNTAKNGPVLWGARLMESGGAIRPEPPSSPLFRRAEAAAATALTGFVRLTMPRRMACLKTGSSPGRPFYKSIGAKFVKRKRVVDSQHDNPIAGNRQDIDEDVSERRQAKSARSWRHVLLRPSESEPRHFGTG